MTAKAVSTCIASLN